MNQLTTPTVDLLAPTNHFAGTSRLYSRMHRYQLFIGKHWWILFFSLLLGIAPVYFITTEMIPSYESKAKMWLPGRLNISESKLYNDDLGNSMGTQVELLRSGAIQDRALARLGSKFGALPAIDKSSRYSMGLKNVWNDSVAQVQNWLHYRPSAATNTPAPFPFQLKTVESLKSSIVEIRATGADPKFTQAFLSNLMEEYLNFKKEAREKTSDRTAASVTEQVNQVERELQAQQEKMHAYQMSNNVVFLQEQGNSAGSYLAGLNKQLSILRTEYQLLQVLKPEHLQELGTKPKGAEPNDVFPGEASAKELLPALVGPQGDYFKAAQQIELMKAKRDELLQYLQPTHPKLLKVNEGISTQQKLVDISRKEGVKQLANRRESIGLEIKNLEAAFKEWDANAIAASRKMVEYERIRQDLQRIQASSDRLRGVVQTLGVSKNLDQDNLGILEPASLALPLDHTIRNLFLGLAGGLALGFGILYLLARFDDRFASISELRSYLSEIVLGEIPAISLKKPKGRLEMDSMEKHRFEFLESFRHIRSSLLFMDTGETRPKTILITSSVPTEGKSTVSIYLAATLAMGGARVLLIDADLRRASLHKYFGATSKPGLAEILGAGADYANVITNTAVDNLSLLPAGEAKRNPGELFSSKGFESFLQKIYPRFDYILMDTPPVLATDDTSCMAPSVDGVLFVVRASFTSARMASQALVILHQRQVNILGIIFNRAAFSSSEQHPYQKYKGAYRWKPNRSKASRHLKPDTAPPKGLKEESQVLR